MAYKVWGTEQLFATDVYSYLANQAIITCTSGDRPPGIQYMRIWETDTGQERMHNGSTWQLMKDHYGFAMSTTDAIARNTTDYETHPELSVPIKANVTYQVDLFLITQMTVQSQMIVRLMTPGRVGGNNSVTSNRTPNDTIISPTATRDSVFLDYIFVFPVGSGWLIGPQQDNDQTIINIRNFTALSFEDGEMTVEFAQAHANDDNSTIIAGSYLWIRPLN